MITLQQNSKKATLESRLPEITGEQCVYSMFASAGCMACVEACPESAWVLGEESLGLDTEACDGCGLCVPACPQGAISLPREVLLRKRQGRRVAVCACERAVPEASDVGVMPCVHALGLSDVLNFYNIGVRDFALLTEDCNECYRGQGTARLNSTIKKINACFEVVAYQVMSVGRLSLSSWKVFLNESPDPSGSELSRRNFLRGLASSTRQKGLSMVSHSQVMENSAEPPGRLLPATNHETQWPWLPEIDPLTCSGCDACSRLCPHKAIVLDNDDGEACSYRLLPEQCTGCELCIDVCDRNSIALYQWKKQTQQEIALVGAKCDACGAKFHVPEVQAQQQEKLCRICVQNNQYSKLFQVNS